MTATRILVGRVGRAHGVRGLVRVQSFTANPDDLARYAPFLDERGRSWSLEWAGAGIARLRDASGRAIATRDEAETLVNTGFYVTRDALPEPDDADEFYLADLVGLAAVGPDRAPLGEVRAVHDYGAGIFLEIGFPDGGEVLIPFTRDAVPEVALGQGRITVVPPALVNQPREQTP